MSTISIIHKNICKKINAVRDALNIYVKYNISPAANHQVESLLINVDDLLSEYKLGSIEYIDTHDALSSVSEQKVVYDKFVKFVGRVNVKNKLRDIYHETIQFVRQYPLDVEADVLVIQKSFSTYKKIPLNVTQTFGHIPSCQQCQKPFDIDSTSSKHVCHTCGETQKLFGMVFTDEQFYHQEGGNRTKHGKYDPAKRCKYWIDRIQAKEKYDIPVDVINRIKKCIKRNRIYLNKLNCELIRQYLKELCLTQYNDHVNLILKLIKKVEPEQLTDTEFATITTYFPQVIKIYNQLKPVDKSNCPYHPYFIYKIIEQIIPNSRRQRAILSCIHLQARETLIENDKMWQQICKYIPQFSYRPTNC